MDSSPEDCHYSSGTNDGDSSQDVLHQSFKVKKFSPAQTTTLKTYYSSGMVGTGKQFHLMIDNSAEDTGLTVVQVQVYLRICCSVVL